MGAWEQIADLPVGLMDHCCETDGQKIYVFGGNKDPGTVNTRIYEYDPRTNTWTDKYVSAGLGAFPDSVNKNDAGAVWDGERIWIIGGIHTAPASDKRVVYSYTPHDNKVHPYAADGEDVPYSVLPVPGSEDAVCGPIPPNPERDFEVYDHGYTRLEYINDANGRRIVVHGGSRGTPSGSEANGRFDIWWIDSGSWTGSSSPQGADECGAFDAFPERLVRVRFQHSSFVYNNRVYAGGGRTIAASVAGMEMLDPDTNEWALLGDGTVGIGGVGAASCQRSHPDPLFFIMGSEHPGSSDFFSWSPVEKTPGTPNAITTMPSMLTQHGRHCGVYLDDYVYVFGGRTGGGVAWSTYCERFGPVGGMEGWGILT